MNQSIQKKQTNRLSGEKSPYLKQHQFNPVDWYPFNEEAFKKAKEQNKPIFLSIGYSTCHWCHVMENESFENETIAAFLNHNFISIKVDREERPDIDRIYMAFVQATTGQGGWPLSVFLTPDGKPFFGGTYFPPIRKYNHPGFLDILREISRLWKENGVDIVSNATEINQKLKELFEERETQKSKISLNTIKETIDKAKSIFDNRFGGFGNAPKFPQPSLLRFLLQQGIVINDEELINAVLSTCKAMAKGGIYDQLGGGFHRYSVDAEWIVPHFEKMLYDNAQLLLLYAEAYQISKDRFFSEVAKGIVNYLVRDMKHYQGAFYSAEDADSEGEEGKFYLWTTEQIRNALTQQEYELAKRTFDLRDDGNFTDPVHPDRKGFNILHMAKVPQPSEEDLYKCILEKLFVRRSVRIRPFRDEKIITLWNGLLAAALAKAGRILNEEEWINISRGCLDFIIKTLWNAQDGTLCHSYCDGVCNTALLQEDYAGLIYGLIEYYQTTLDDRYLAASIRVAEAMIVNFEDKENGGFWQTLRKNSDLILNLKDSNDGAICSGNSLATYSLLKLYDITGRDEFLQTAEKTIEYFSSQIEQNPLSMCGMLSTFYLLSNERLRIGIFGDNRTDFINKLYLKYIPMLTISGKSGVFSDTSKQLPTDKTIAVPCIGNRCLRYAKTPQELMDIVSKEILKLFPML